MLPSRSRSSSKPNSLASRPNFAAIGKTDIGASRGRPVSGPPSPSPRCRLSCSVLPACRVPPSARRGVVVRRLSLRPAVTARRISLCAPAHQAVANLRARDDASRSCRDVLVGWLSRPRCSPRADPSPGLGGDVEVALPPGGVHGGLDYGGDGLGDGVGQLGRDRQDEGLPGRIFGAERCFWRCAVAVSSWRARADNQTVDLVVGGSSPLALAIDPAGGAAASPLVPPPASMNRPRITVTTRRQPRRLRWSAGCRRSGP